MTVEEIIQRNLPKETVYCNGIEYILITEKDGRITIIQKNNAGYKVLIQAKDKPHALGYIDKIEPITVPIKPIL